MLEHDERIVAMVGKLSGGDSVAEHELWGLFFGKLVMAARKRLVGTRKREFDEEDIAIKSLYLLFRLLKDRRLPEVKNHLDLWKVLVTIMTREISTQRKLLTASKRGRGKVRGESVFFSSHDDSETPGLNQFPLVEPAPDVAVQVAETAEQMIAQLNDESLQRVAFLKLEGYTNLEIAQQMGCVERTVERNLNRIRDIWQKSGSD